MTNEIKRTAAHTPGPWAVDSDRYGTFVRAIQTGNTIIDVHEPLTVASGEAGTMEKRRILEANARLIAATPGLLEVVERAIASLGYDHDNKIHKTAGVYCYVCQTHGETSATLPHKESCLKRQMREAVRAARGEE